MHADTQQTLRTPTIFLCLSTWKEKSGRTTNDIQRCSNPQLLGTNSGKTTPKAIFKTELLNYGLITGSVSDIKAEMDQPENWQRRRQPLNILMSVSTLPHTACLLEWVTVDAYTRSLSGWPCVCSHLQQGRTYKSCQGHGQTKRQIKVANRQILSGKKTPYKIIWWKNWNIWFLSPQKQRKRSVVMWRYVPVDEDDNLNGLDS